MTTSRICERRAVIDVGTNSVKLLMADVGRTVTPVLRVSRQTRLGQGSFRTKWLHPEAVARTAAAVAELGAQAAELRPLSIRVLATSATREAANGSELVQAIQRAVGLNVEIISGDLEAEYVFRGVTSDPAFAEQPLLIVDVGGGSTEWVVGEGAFTYFCGSTHLGTTRLLEMNPPGDPPTPEDLMVSRNAVSDFVHWELRSRLGPTLRSFCGREVRLVGLGGGLRTLARLSAAQGPPRRGEPVRLGLNQIREQVERLWGLCSRERRQLDGLDPEKADVILSGAVIYEAVMAEFNFSEVFVSQRGLRDGALMTGPEARSFPFAGRESDSAIAVQPAVATGLTHSA